MAEYDGVRGMPWVLRLVLLRLPLLMFEARDGRDAAVAKVKQENRERCYSRAPDFSTLDRSIQSNWQKESAVGKYIAEASGRKKREKQRQVKRASADAEVLPPLVHRYCCRYRYCSPHSFPESFGGRSEDSITSWLPQLHQLLELRLRPYG